MNTIKDSSGSVRRWLRIRGLSHGASRLSAHALKRLGLAVVTLVGIGVGIGATGASSSPGEAPGLSDIATVTIVEGADDISSSGFVHGTVRHLESLHGLSNGELAEQAAEVMAQLGCERVSSLSGHGRVDGDTRGSTMVADQLECGGFDAEIGWSTEVSGVNVVIGTD